MEREDVIQKIKKLLKLQYGAEKVGSAGEAYQTARMVQKLLLEYNLSQKDIETADDGTAQKVTESDPLSYTDYYGAVWKRSLLVVICENNLCKVVTTPGLKRMNIVGTEANVIICKEFYQYLTQVFRRLSMERLNEAQNTYLGTGKFMTEPMKKDFVRSYLEGVSEGLDENYASRRPTSEETGLVLSHGKLIESYLKEKNVRKGRSRSGWSHLRPDGFGIGYEDGKNVSLDRQIKGGVHRQDYIE